MFDVLVVGGTLHDGSGDPGRRADVGIQGDRVVAIGALEDGASEAPEVLDATGLVVAPGFINPLSHSYFSMLEDPRSLGELLQGVTTQVFGEGDSLGPLNAAMRRDMAARLASLDVEVSWSRLSEFLALLARRGVSQNICSFVGAATIRQHVLGAEQRKVSPRELDVMVQLVAEEIDDGAIGVGSSLIYPPGSYASTEELLALCTAAAAHGGSYISHVRSEGDRLLEGITELVTIATRAGLPAEVFHLKALGRRNWPLMDRAIDLIQQARDDGIAVTADAYPYTANGTHLHACLPPELHAGGHAELIRRLADPAIREQAKLTMVRPGKGWENMYELCGGAAQIVVVGAGQPYQQFAGKTLAEIAEALGTDAPEAAIRLIEATPLDEKRGVQCVFFTMSDQNVEKVLRLPWVSLGSDAPSIAAEEPRRSEPTHPRAYGCFARFLGHYVRERKLTGLPDAVRRLASLPATNLGLAGRGRVEEESFADLVIFDPEEVADYATYEQPHQYAIGVRAVLVNGAVAVREGRFTGRLAGRHLRRGVKC